MLPLDTKTISSGMIKLLIECHEREARKQTPCDALSLHSKGLIQRNMVIVKPFFDERGKKIISIFLTEKGRLYIDLIMHNQA